MADGESDVASVTGSAISQQALGEQRVPTRAERLIHDGQLSEAAAIRAEAIEQVATALAAIQSLREGQRGQNATASAAAPSPECGTLSRALTFQDLLRAAGPQRGRRRLGSGLGSRISI